MSLTPLERITSQTTLGIRFYDGVLARVISDGLRVQAQRLSVDGTQRLGKPVMGRVTSSGVIAFFGLSANETLPAGTDSQLWDVVPAAQNVAIDVMDSRGRYLPMSFQVQMPQRGAFRGRGSWQTTVLARPIPASADDDQGVMVWSAAGRSAPNGFANVRAQLVDVNDVPLAHALVEITQPAEFAPLNTTYNHFAISDASGNVNLILPYPPIPPPQNGNGNNGNGNNGGGNPNAANANADTNPAAARGRGRRGNRGNAARFSSQAADDPMYPALDAQTFTLDVRVFHSAAQQHFLTGSSVPDMESILMQPAQQIGEHWESAAQTTLTTVGTLRTTLQFGQTLALGTRLGEPLTADREAVLRIQ